MPKRHLARRARLAACGVRNPSQITRDPSEVTCLGCQRTVFMADTEMRIRLKRDRKNNNPFGKRSNQ